MSGRGGVEGSSVILEVSALFRDNNIEVGRERGILIGKILELFGEREREREREGDAGREREMRGERVKEKG